MERKIISLSPSLSQVYLRKLAMWGSSSLSNDIFFLKEFVDMAINEIGEERFVEMLKTDESENKKKNNEIGNNWEKIKGDLSKFDRKLTKSKKIYDLIENKKFSKITAKQEKEFLEISSKIGLIKQNIYVLAVFVIKNTSLGRQTIPSEAWKIMERSYKVIGHLPTKQVIPPSQDIEITHE